MELALAARVEADDAHPSETALESDPAPEQLPPSSKQVSVRQIARIAKVSVATVSLVINDHPRISAATKKRVRRIMETVGLSPESAGSKPLAQRHANARGDSSFAQPRVRG